MKRYFFKIPFRLVRPLAVITLLTFTTTGWAQNEVEKIVASDADTWDIFGFACAISGDTAVVGAPFDDHDDYDWAGSVYIYQRDQDCTDCWGEVAILRPEDLVEDDVFGVSVSINEDTVIVGAAGGLSAYIFDRNHGGTNSWGLVTTLTGSYGTYFGASVSIHGDLAIVSSPGWYFGRGRATIYGRNQGGSDNWGIIDNLEASDAAAGDDFGRSVAIFSDDLAVIGAPLDNTGEAATGSAYIFRHAVSPSAWEQEAKITDSGGAAADLFGCSVSISGGMVIIGAKGDDTSTGSAHIFERDGSSWDFVKRITASDADTNEYFGASVSIRNDGAIVGAFDRDDKGAAYVFRKNEDEPNNWGQVGDPITAFDGAAGDKFGFTVLLDGDFAVIGAYQNDDGGTNSGSAYIFDDVCPCPWDLDSSDQVDVNDLIDLLNQWEDDPGVPPDFDDDGDVDFDDLQELLDNWGNCPCIEGAGPPSLEDELENVCLDLDDWDDFEYVLENGPQLDTENYLCWMLHYLEYCDKCSCTVPPNCPDDDPFDD